MTYPTLHFLGALALAGSLVACDSASPIGGGGQLSLNVSSRAAAGTAISPPSAPDTLVDASGNVLVLTHVEIVLRDIEFRRQNHDDCDSVNPGSDDCEEFAAGPVVLDLPLGAGVSTGFVVSVDSGVFSELELKIHKPEDDGDQQDRAFLALHPDLADVSIRVTGSFNGTAFTFVTDLGAEQEIVLSPPVVVTSRSDVAVTLRVDVARWFLSGAVLVDPALALKGGTFEGLVKNNIEASFAAFRDDNRNGRDDGQDDRSS